MSMKNLSRCQLENFIITNKLNVAQASAAMQTAGLTRQERIQILTKTGLIQQTSQQIAMNGGLAVSIRSVTAALRAQVKAWLATPFGMATAAAAGIFVIVKAINYFSEAVDRSREKLASLKEEFNSNKSEISNLTTEIETATSRIKELNSLRLNGLLTVADTEELDRLKAENVERERQVHLLELEQKLKQQKINSTFVDTMHKSMDVRHSGFNQMSEGSNLDYQLLKYEAFNENLISLETKYQEDIEAASKDGDEKRAARIEAQYEKDKAYIESQTEYLLRYLLEKNTEFQTDMEGVSYIADPNDATEEQVNAWLDFIGDFQDRLAIATGGEHAKTDAINRLMTQTFADATEELRELGKQGLVTANHLDNEKYRSFIDKLIELGVIADDGTESLGFVALAFNSLGSAIDSSIEDTTPLNEVLSGFSDFSTYVNSATESLSALAEVEDRVNKGLTVSIEKVMELAKSYPEILKNATVAADGQVKLNKDVVNSLIKSKRDEVNASIDAEISKLEADKASLEAKMYAAEAQLELAKSVGEGEGQISKEFAEYKLNAYNALTAALIDMGVQEAEASAMAAAAMSNNQEEFGRVAGSVFDNVQQNTINSMFASARSVYTNTGAMRRSFASVAAQAHEMAIAIFNAANGLVAGSSSDVGGGQDGVRTGSASLDFYTGNFNGSTYSYDLQQIDLDSFISDLELDISSYKEAIAQIDGQIAVLEAMKKSPLKNFLDNDKSNSGSKDSNKKRIEEYISTLDKYAEALQRLEDAQRKRLALEKQLEHTEDIYEKILLSGDLIDAYKEEAEAEKKLIDAKKQTILMNIEALKNLGFEVDYNSDTNRLYIKNLEHLNELTADSAGEYDSQSEATNALRKETEELIKATEQLNDENVQSAENIEDLGYSIVDTKNNIIDAIEEIYDKQVDAYQKVIDERKKLIESAKDELDYEEQIAEKVEEIARLQADIDRLSLDDSRGAQAEANVLKEQLAEKQKELGDLQKDHSSDAQLEALDKMAEDFETQKADEIEVLRQSVDTSDELWNAFYQSLLGNTVELADSINFEISNAWLAAADAVRQYQDTVSSVVGAPSAVVVPTYHNGGIVDSDDLPKYHSGGLVGNSTMEKDEVLAVLEDGELILNNKHQVNLQKIMTFQDKLLNVLFGQHRNTLSSGVRTDTTALTSNPLSHAITNNQSITLEPHIEVSIQSNGSLNMDSAKAYGSRIASATIDSLYEAFERRGMINTKCARLRP